MSRYWFARRFPVGHRRNAMVPVSREGFAVAGVFVAAMLVGALALILLGMNGQLVSGLVLFLLLALAGGWMFIGMAAARGDRDHTVDDYRQGRVG